MFCPDNVKLPVFKKEFCRIPFPLFKPLIEAAKLLNKMSFFPTMPIRNDILWSSVPTTFIWKSVNQSCNLPFLVEVFPGIRIVYLIRSPYAVIASFEASKNHFMDGDNKRRIMERSASEYFAVTGVDPEEVESMSELQRLALLWRVNCESALAFSTQYDSLLVIKYEDMLTDTERIAEKMFRFLGMTLCEEVRSFLDDSDSTAPLVKRLLSSQKFSMQKERSTQSKKSSSQGTLPKSVVDSISPILEDSPFAAWWQ